MPKPDEVGFFKLQKSYGTTDTETDMKHILRDKSVSHLSPEHQKILLGIDELVESAQSSQGFPGGGKIN